MMSVILPINRRSGNVKDCDREKENLEKKNE